MTLRDPPNSVSAHIEGDVAGQVAVGNYILQVGSVHGGVVNIAAPGQQLKPHGRSAPVLLRPRRLRGCVDRQVELQASVGAIRSGLTLEVSGEPGVGKTALLRLLAHSDVVSTFPDGVVYLSVRQPLDDLLQSLFDAFYETPTPYKPTDAELHLALQDKKALLLLDDVSFTRTELETVLDALPTSTIVVVTRERTLWGEVKFLPLRGLPEEDATALLERELARPVTDEERPALRELASALGGHPMRLLQAGASAREESRAIVDVLRAVQAAPSPRAVTAQVLQSLEEREQRLLAAITAVGDAGISASVLGELTDLRDPEALLQGLMGRGLVETQKNRYSLAPGVAAAASESLDVRIWEDRAIDFFVAWADQHRRQRSNLVEESSALLAAQQRAADKGRWKDVLRLGWLVGIALVFSGQWEAWAAVLKRNLQAARALEDTKAEALVFHEAGTRALCLGDSADAQKLLVKAVSLRDAVGDQAGAAVSRHNAGLLAPPAPVPSQKSHEPDLDIRIAPEDSSLPLQPLESARLNVPPSAGSTSLVAWTSLALLGLIGAGGLGFWFMRGPEPAPTPDAVNIGPAPEPPAQAGPQPEPPAQTVPQPAGPRPPTIGITPGEVQFGPHALRTVADPRGLLITNLGSELLAVSRLELSGPNASDFSAQRDSCLTPLAGGDSCRITVSFTPSTEGNKAAVLTINGSDDTAWRARLSGAGAPEARPIVSFPPAVDFGGRPIKTPADSREVLIGNRGTAPLKIDNARVDGDHAGDFTIVTDRCSGVAVEQRAECSVQIRFVPSDVGTRVARLMVNDSADGSPHVVVLSGVGTEVPTPAARLAPVSVVFPMQVVRQPGAPRNVRVTNAGNAPLVVERVSVEGIHAGDFQIRQNACESPVAASASCTIEVAFIPLGAGPREAVLSLSHNGGTGRSVTLLGTALSPPRPVARLQPLGLDFGRQLQDAVSAPQPVSIVNVGGGTLLIGGAGITGDHPRDFSAENTCSDVKLARGQDCAIVIRFTPSGPGARRAQLLLSDNTGEPQQRVTLEGIGEITARLDVRPLQVDFGAQSLRTSSAPRSVSIRNGGTANLVLERIGISGAHASDFLARRVCRDATLPGGAACEIEVHFTPSAPGARTATLSIASTESGVRDVPLTGSGEGAGRIDITPLSVDFGVQPIRTPSGSRSITVSNTGAATITLGTMSVDGPDARDFQIVNTGACARAALESRQSCVIEVRFVPVREASLTARLMIADATGAVRSVALGGEGRAARPEPPTVGELVLLPLRLDFGRVNLRAAGKAQPISLENQGNGAVGVGQLAVSGRDAADFVVRDPQRCAGSTLRPRQRCQIEVTFLPRGGGDRVAVLHVASAQGSLEQATLGGFGVALLPIVLIDPDRIDFGVQVVEGTDLKRTGSTIRMQVPLAAGASRDITVRNVGQVDALIGGITVEGPNSGDFIVSGPSSCGRLDPDRTCTIRVTFRANGIGPRRATLVVAHNAAGSPRNVSLSGERRLRDPGGPPDSGNEPPRACTDLAVRSIEFATIRRTNQFEAVVRISATVRNNGPGLLTPSSNGVARLYEGSRVVRNEPLRTLTPGQEMSVSYERNWNSSSASEGEFPPEYRVEVSASTDCNAGNNRTTRSGSIINDGLRGPDNGGGGKNLPPPAIERFFAIDDKPGERPSLCYVVTGATRAQINPEIGQIKLGNGTICLTVNPARTTTYRLTAENAAGRSVSQTATVQVTPRVVKPPPPKRPPPSVNQPPPPERQPPPPARRAPPPAKRPPPSVKGTTPSPR